MYITLNNISKTFGSSDAVITAVNNVNLSIGKNSFTALKGVSGSGKTTLLTILAGLQPPSEGTVTVDGISLYEELNNEGRAKFRSEYAGFVFQSFNLIPYLTVLENVMLPLAHQKYSKKKKTDMAEEALQLVGLLDRKKHLPSKISGGQQQRAAIARAIVNQPEIIFADEPTGNLDSKTRDEILLLFKRLNESGKTIIMVSHDEQITEAAGSIINISDGQIV